MTRRCTRRLLRSVLPASHKALSRAPERLRPLGEQAGRDAARRRDMVGLAHGDHRREARAPRRQRLMRCGKRGENDEILIVAEAVAQSLRLAGPQFPEPRPQGLEQIHLIAVHDDALAQAVQMLVVVLGRRRRSRARGDIRRRNGGRVPRRSVRRRPGSDLALGGHERRLQSRAHRAGQRAPSRRRGAASRCADVWSPATWPTVLRPHRDRSPRRARIAHRGRRQDRGRDRAPRSAGRWRPRRRGVPSSGETHAIASSPCGNRAPRGRRPAPDRGPRGPPTRMSCATAISAAAIVWPGRSAGLSTMWAIYDGAI